MESMGLAPLTPSDYGGTKTFNFPVENLDSDVGQLTVLLDN